MNLDNYFAKYLCKKNATGASDTAEAVPQADATPPPRSISIMDNSSPEEAATAGRGKHRSSNTFMVLTDAGVEEEELLHPEKRSRAETEPKTATIVSRRIREEEDDDEDELDVLLGKAKAQEVKSVDNVQAQARRSGGDAPAAPQHAMPEEAGAEVHQVHEVAATASTVKSLPWSTSTNKSRAKYSQYFADQFDYQLHHDGDLFSCFEPFFRDKVLDRIERGDDIRPVFIPAPVISASTTGALPGCVLRDYQVQGVQFLLDNFHRGMSCILSDDMGLGKTAQIASFLHTLKTVNAIDGPHLIVAPLSTLTSWTRELARWGPGLKVIKYHGERRARQQARSSRHNRHAVIVTTPAVLNQDRGFFKKRSWVTVVVDEAHVLKGHNTNVTSICRKLTACFRIAVTGTPVHNNVREVWSLMGFLYPMLTAGFDKGSVDMVQAAEDCARLLQHVMLRRTKESMELGIPPRVDEPLVLLEPTYVQSQLLSALTDRALEDDSGGRQLQGHLSHQRVTCNHPMALRLLAAEEKCGANASLEDRLEAAGVKMDDTMLVAPSAKMIYLDGLLPQLRADGHRCLIFSNFTSTLDLLQAYCVLRGYSYERLDGSCNRVERELSMLRFNAPGSTCFLFLVTTTAGGVGVTLTGADTVILFDAHFNPQLDRQAADRAHRLGQTRTVHVYRLCLVNTVEEHIRDIAARKASLGDFIVDGGRTKGSGGADAPQLTSEDIRRMMESLDSNRRERQATLSSPTAADLHRASELSVSCSQRLAEDKTVEDLINIEANGLPGARGARQYGGGRNVPIATHNCFVCGDIMHPLEPLYHCIVCPKAYHAGCLGLKKPKPGDATTRNWSCTRHTCYACGKAQAADGAIFMCVGCPRSYCFDCLDPRYLAMDDKGTDLLHIKRTYDGAVAEGVVEKRSSYYITCLHCCGVVSSSDSEGGSSGSDEHTDDASDDDDDDGGVFEVSD